MAVLLRSYRGSDAEAVNRAAAGAFAQYAGKFEDWDTLYAALCNMSVLSDSGLIVVAEKYGEVAGAVCYVPPFAPRFGFFEPEWAVIRSLVVRPSDRGCGIGRMLAEACIEMAATERCRTIALHTTPVMESAVRLYEKLGFERTKSIGTIHGAPYFVYCKQL